MGTVKKTGKKKKQKYKQGTVDLANSKNGQLVKILLKLHDLRAPISVKDLHENFDKIGMRRFKRYLETLNAVWITVRKSPLFQIVDHEGEPWHHGVKLEQHIARTEKSLDIQGIGHAQRRLVSLVAVTSLLGIKNLNLLKEESGELRKGIVRKLPRDEKQVLERSQKKFYSKIQGQIDYTKYDDVLNALYQALMYDKQLKIKKKTEYGGLDDAQVIEPLCLISFKSALYLAFRYPDTTGGQPQLYTIRVTNIEDATVGKQFGYPYTTVDPDKEFGEEFGMYQSKKTPDKEITIKIQIKAKSTALSHITERTWGRNQQVTNQRDESSILTFQAYNTVELAAFVLGYGAEITVIEPQTLREGVKKIINDMRNIYEQ